MFAVNLGILISFIAGTFLSYRVVPCVMLVVPICFLVSFFFFPVKAQQRHNVKKSLKYKEDHSKEIQIALKSLNKESIGNNINDSCTITFSELGKF